MTFRGSVDHCLSLQVKSSSNGEFSEYYNIDKRNISGYHCQEKMCTIAAPMCSMYIQHVCVCFNPLTTEFFPPRQHIFMHSAHTTFVGTPLPQHLLLSGQTWWGPHTWRDPSGNTVNDVHDPPQAQQSEVKGGCQPDFRPAFP